MIDITGAKDVVVEIRDDGKVIWIHVSPDGRVAASQGADTLDTAEVTVLRVCRVENIIIDDNREVKP